MTRLAVLLAFLWGVPAGAQIPYFGYYGSEGIGGGCVGGCATETKDHTNVIHIVGYIDWQDGGSCGRVYYWECQMLAAKANGQKAVVEVKGILFDPVSLWVWPSASARWAVFASAMQPYTQSVAAWTTVDEPFLQPFLGGRTITKLQLKWMLEIANGIIKGDPRTATIPIAVTLAAEELKPGSYTELPEGAIPWGYDWIGFDCYGRWDTCGDGWTIQQVTALLRSKVSFSQRLLFVPDGVMCSNIESWCVNTVTELLDRVNRWWALIRVTPGVALVLPYTWHSYDGGSWGWMTGVRDMPDVRTWYVALGKAILAGQY